MRVAAALGGLIVSAAACSLVTDFPKLTGASSDGGASDGAYCRGLAPTPQFCDDFDEESALTPKWDSRSDGGVTIDGVGAHSAPSTMRSAVPAGAPDCTNAVAEKTLRGAFLAAHASFWLRFDDAAELSKGPAVAALYLGLSSSDPFCQLLLVLSGSPTFTEQRLSSLPDGGHETVQAAHALDALAPGEWHHLDIDYDTANGRLVVAANGTGVVDAALQLSCGKQAAAATLQLGHYCIEPGSPALEIRFDDVTFDGR